MRVAAAASLLVGIGLLQASSQVQAAPASLSLVEEKSPSPSSSTWPVRRHGDHGHDEEEHEDEDVAQHADHSAMAGMDSHAHAHGHSHPAPPPVPSLQEAGLEPLAVPFVSGGGHSHVHSDAPAEVHLNESKLLHAKGPEPLSYVEWDFAYGLGSLDSLRRFTSDSYRSLDAASEYGAMGALDTRYRRLLDEVDPKAREAITQDIASRVAGNEEPARHTWLLVLHVLGAMVSCFVLLPLALFLKAAESSLAPLASLVYLASLAGSLVLSSLYKALTPQFYPKNVHGRMGWAILWISLICLGADVFRLLKQVVTLFRSGAKLHSFLHLATGSSSSSDEKYSPVEEEHMLAGDVDEEEDAQRQPHHVHFAAPQHQDSLDTLNDDGNAWAQRTRNGGDDGSVSPSSTLVGANGTLRNNSFTEMLAQKLPWKLRSPASSYNDGHAARIESWRSATPPSARPTSPPPVVAASRRSKASLLRSILRYTHVTVSRGLVVVCFGAAYTGLAVYTGTCRKPNQNGCLAHGIKGGIFFWYGLLTFARYLGAYADCGWSWNRRPSPETASAGKRSAGWKANMPSAEWVESLVIFTYGATNTWMERFDAKSGDPYTVKQVQHISIAVMYWFAGALGVLLETRWVRNLLSFPVALTHPSAAELSVGQQQQQQQQQRARSRHGAARTEADQEPLVAAQAAPPSYSSSFNPFPALCIGVTGVAMAAHHQDYVYEVQIHSLWGQLLAAFALLRCITYFFLWLRPPSASILPSRPPTEALASFCLASGGLVFMISTEDVSFAAMRNGFGDFMAILCITVAVICFVFALIAGLFVVKAWAVRREYRKREGTKRVAMTTTTTSRSSRQPHSTVSASSPSQREDEDGEAVFVLGEDGEDEVSGPPAAASRHLSQSPDNLV